MNQFFKQKDTHMNPKTFLVLAALMRSKVKGAVTSRLLFDFLTLASDDKGESNGKTAALAVVLAVSVDQIKAGLRLLESAGLIEYLRNRGDAGNVYRLNPEALSFGRKYTKEVKLLADPETGEETRKQVTVYSKEYKVLLERYNGKQLDTKLASVTVELLTKHARNIVVISK